MRAAQTFEASTVDPGQAGVFESDAVVEDHVGEGSSGTEDDRHAVTVEAGGDELGIGRVGGRCGECD